MASYSKSDELHFNCPSHEIKANTGGKQSPANTCSPRTFSWCQHTIWNYIWAGLELVRKLPALKGMGGPKIKGHEKRKLLPFACLPSLSQASSSMMLRLRYYRTHSLGSQRLQVETTSLGEWTTLIFLNFPSADRHCWTSWKAAWQLL